MKAATLEALQNEQKPSPEWKGLQELVEEQNKLGVSQLSSQQHTTTTEPEYRYLDNVAAAFLLPIPTELPPLPPALDKEVFRLEDTPSPVTPHFEVLEWTGD